MSNAPIQVIVGTNRPGSASRQIASHLVRAYESLGSPVALLDLGTLPPDLFAPTAYADKPAAFAPFAQAVTGSAGLHVVTPEYNGGFPGVLKYFIDMLPFPESFESRPVCFTGVAAGLWGALRPVEQLQQIFGYRNAHIFPKRVFIPGVGNVLADDGAISDADIAARLDGQAKGFLAFVSTFKNDPR